MNSKTKKPKKLPKVDSYVKSKLRSATLWWPGRTEAIKRSRVEPGKFRCDQCQQIFSTIKTEVIKNGKRKIKYKYPLELDHIESIVPMDGSGLRKDGSGRIDWNIWIDRAFCPPELFSTKCKNCHDVKTKLENHMRQYYKDESQKKTVEEFEKVKRKKK